MCGRWLDNRVAHVEELQYLSRLAYDLARNVTSEDKKKEVSNEVRESLCELTKAEHSPLMAKLRLPITWALLKHRREKR